MNYKFIFFDDGIANAAERRDKHIMIHLFQWHYNRVYEFNEGKYRRTAARQYSTLCRLFELSDKKRNF